MRNTSWDTAGSILFLIMTFVILVVLMSSREMRRSRRLIGIGAMIILLVFLALDLFLGISQSFWPLSWLIVATVYLFGLVIERRSVAYRLRDRTFSHPKFESLQDLNVAEGWRVPESDDMLLLLSPSPFGYKTEGNLNSCHQRRSSRLVGRVDGHRT